MIFLNQKRPDSDARGAESTDDWYGEVQAYDFSTGDSPTGQTIGHFTQVVWQDTQLVGCGKAYGDSNKYSVVVCRYYPGMIFYIFYNNFHYF